MARPQHTSFTAFPTPPDPARSAHAPARRIGFEEWLDARAPYVGLTGARHAENVSEELDLAIKQPMLAGEQLLDRLRNHRDLLARELVETDHMIMTLSVVLAESSRRLKVAEAPQSMTITRAAKYLGVARNTVYRMIDDGEIPTYDARGDSNRVWIRKSDLDSYIAGRPAKRRQRRTAGSDVASEPATTA